MPSSARERVFRVLHLEDSELDHELLVAHLARGGLNAQTRRIESESAFLEALDEPWDAVVSDYNLPGFSGLVALELLKASMREIPFILVSGEIGEDTAVEAMRNGASDYLQKTTSRAWCRRCCTRSTPPRRGARASGPTATWSPRSSACTSLRSTCRRASSRSGRRSRARSTTTSAAR